MSISCGSGSRLPGGRHLRTLRHEHVGAGQADLVQQRVEQPPGLADERQALLVLVGARAPRRRTSGRRRRCRSRRRPSCGWPRAAGSACRSGACCQTALSSSRRSEALDMSPRVPPAIRRKSRRLPPHLRAVSLRCRAGISMRELDPKSPQNLPACAVVGAGRLGTVLAAALRAAPAAAARRADPGDVGGRPAVRARRQDRRGRARRAGRAAASATAPARPGSTSLGGREAFSLHPLMSVPDRQRAERAARRRRGGRRDHAERALAIADALAARARHARDPRRARGPRRLPRRRRDRRRTSSSRSRPAPSGWRRRPAITREQLAPLVLATADQWAELGPEAALTGPIARGDEDDGRAPPRRDRRAHARAAARVGRARRGHPRRGG